MAKYARGQRWRPSSRELNQIADTASRPTDGWGADQLHRDLAAGIIPARLGAGGSVGQYWFVRVTGPYLTLSGDDLDGDPTNDKARNAWFNRRYSNIAWPSWPSGVIASAASAHCYGVTLEPIYTGRVGRVAVTGVVPVRIKTEESGIGSVGLYARPSHGQFWLSRDWYGYPFMGLGEPDEDGLAWAYINLNQFHTPTYYGLVTSTSPLKVAIAEDLTGDGYEISGPLASGMTETGAINFDVDDRCMLTYVLGDGRWVAAG
jgi:hypothetical protein